MGGGRSVAYPGIQRSGTVPGGPVRAPGARYDNRATLPVHPDRPGPDEAGAVPGATYLTRGRTRSDGGGFGSGAGQGGVAAGAGREHVTSPHRSDRREVSAPGR